MVFALVKVYKKATKHTLALDGPSDNDLLKGILEEMKSNK